MSTNIPEILNPLQHAGTSKFERLADEMAFDFVEIEERHEAEFLKGAKLLMSRIQFYDELNQPAGDWSPFFDASVSENQPHKALFIAFLRLLEALNEHANGLTKRHLDYYYRDILQFVEREASPKKAHLFFKCAKGLKTQFLAKQAKLVAGKNADGEKILFELVQELVVNQAEINSFFAVYKHNTLKGSRLFAKDYSSNITEEGAGFPAFGEQQLDFVKEEGKFLTHFSNPAAQTMDHAEVGFAIGSPMLLMPEGRREIKAHFFLKEADRIQFDPTDFRVAITTEDGWLNIDQKVAKFAFDPIGDGIVANAGKLSVTIVLDDTDSAIVHYDQEIHAGNYATSEPVLKLVLRHFEKDEKDAAGKARLYAYEKLKAVKIWEVKLAVDVKGFRSLIVQNDLAPLDPSKPFKPFGPIPSLGNNFYIGHPEIFKHKLEDATFNILWKDIPNKKLNLHYADYDPDNELPNPITTQLTNDKFTVKTAILENKVWENEQTNIPLFVTNDAKAAHAISVNNNRANRGITTENNQEWSYKTHYGFIKLTLEGPEMANFQAFGHSVYPKEVVRNSILDKTINVPYVPVISELRLDYITAEVTFSDEDEDKFFNLSAFGQVAVELANSINESAILPEYGSEGELYIGLSKIELPQSISLLFQLIEGTGEASQSQIDSRITWQYLSGDDWKPLNRLRISQDTTVGLLNTGIIRFDLPKDLDDQHHIMPTGQFWLKALMPEKIAGIDLIQNIHIQAAEVIEVDPNLNDQVIKPKSITKLVNGGRGISKIEQPYASFAGNNAETEVDFYTRVTERLRHKDRGIMIWDYERLVLDEFPNLYKVKCLNHTDYQTEMHAGNVMMAVIPNLINQDSKSPFQPKLSMHKRREIYDYLRARISPFIYLRIENPIYEPIQLSFNVGFHTGYDEGFYGQKLHDDIQAFLSPWAFETEMTNNSKLVFGGSLHKSVVLKFIEDLPYVDFVNDFNMYHQYQDPRIKAHFQNEIDGITNQLGGFNHHSYDPIEGTGSTKVKFALFTNDPSQATCLIDLNLRFLKGIIELTDDELYKKFVKQITTILKKRVAKGIVITKNLVRVLVKSIFYIDKIIAIDFYKELPDDFVLEDVDVAKAKSSRSIMVTSEQHRIGVYRAGDYKCEGSVMIGIGFMIVEADFIIPPIKKQNYEFYAR